MCVCGGGGRGEGGCRGRSSFLLEFTVKDLHSFFFFYKNLFHKNVEAGIGQNLKNMLRTYPACDVVKNVFILSSYL